LVKWRATLPESASVAADDLWLPQATTVGQLAWRRHLAGDYDDLWQLTPQYYRPSYAEEKRTT
jgi:hypothetical protein